MRESRARKIFNVCNIIILLLVAAVTLIPCLYVVAMSLSDNLSVQSGTVFLIPKGINLEAYKVIAERMDFWIGYKNTLYYTVTGTLLSLFMTVLCAYPLSKKGLPGRRGLMGLMIFTMYFSGGMIPTYLLVSRLQLTNTAWAIILPGTISTYNMIVMRTFFEGIPDSLEEAARIDGLNYFGVLMKIILPLSKPILATMSLFYALWYWNDWFSSMLYLTDNNRYPVTMILRNIILGAQMAMRNPTSHNPEGVKVVAQTIQSATIVMVMLPILCIYPFIQKYFVQGVMIGAVKE